MKFVEEIGKKANEISNGINNYLNEVRNNFPKNFGIFPNTGSISISFFGIGNSRPLNSTAKKNGKKGGWTVHSASLAYKIMKEVDDLQNVITLGATKEVGIDKAILNFTDEVSKAVSCVAHHDSNVDYVEQLVQTSTPNEKKQIVDMVMKAWQALSDEVDKISKNSEEINLFRSILDSIKLNLALLFGIRGGANTVSNKVVALKLKSIDLQDSLEKIGIKR